MIHAIPAWLEPNSARIVGKAGATIVCSNEKVSADILRATKVTDGERLTTTAAVIPDSPL